MKKIKIQFLIYIVGGVISAIIDVGIMHILISSGINPVFSASAGFISSLIFNYIFHAKVTFKNNTTPKNLFRFGFLVGLNYIITITFVGIADIFSLNPLIGKFASMPVVAINGFLISKHWIYKKIDNTK